MRIRKYTTFTEIDDNMIANFYWANEEDPYLIKTGTAKFSRERWGVIVLQLKKHMPLKDKWLIHHADKSVTEFKYPETGPSKPRDTSPEIVPRYTLAEIFCDKKNMPIIRE